MNLGLVIPVRNDQAALDRLLQQARTMGVFDQVVVVDDASDEPVQLPDLGALPARLVLHEQSLGPGPARNLGLERLETSHVLFFDSDDLLTAEFPWLWQDLRGRDFDFCLFRHCDSRQAALGQWGLSSHDAALWREAGMGGRALAPVNETGRAALAQTANFPWNKIWRREALRDFGIHFAAARVHQDIPPHWVGFSKAHRILASDRVAAIHHVANDGDRLTNLRGPERLDVCDLLQEVLTQLQVIPPERSGLLPAFWRFSATLLDWVRGNIDLRWHADLSKRQARFWHRAISSDQLAQLTVYEPELAAQVRRQMGQGAPC